MITKLENQNICAVINSQGAELASLILKKDQTEYLWNANPGIWGRHAPVLFPIVGGVIDNHYKIGERIFELSQHGFARDMNFKKVEMTLESVIYRLTSDEFTLVKFPYKFQLDISYRLKNYSVIVEYRVKNIDKHPIFFSIGSHPGFNCPLLPNEKFEDYYLEFQEKETTYRYYLENGLIAKKELFLQNENIVPLSDELFKDGALVFKNLRSQQISLKSRKSEKTITVKYQDFPFMGIWSKAGGAPFVCIEPWCGIADTVGEPRDFRQKEGIISLDYGQEFTRKYSLILT
jgi:galactose mutarotase-like enzyme